MASKSANDNMNRINKSKRLMGAHARQAEMPGGTKESSMDTMANGRHMSDRAAATDNRRSMRKGLIPKRGFAYIAALLAVVATLFGATAAWAAGSLHPSGDMTTFAYDMKLTSVTIDAARLKDSANAPIPTITNGNFVRSGNEVKYIGVTEADKGSVIKNSGECFYYTYKDAATLSDRSKADVIVSYSDVDIYISEYAKSSTVPGSGKPNGNVIVAQGTNARSGVEHTGETGESWYVGVEETVRVYVVKNGQPVEGDLILSMWGINVNRGLNSDGTINTNNNYTRIFQGDQKHGFAEQIEIDKASVSDDIFYPDTDYKSLVVDGDSSGDPNVSAGNVLFAGLGVVGISGGNDYRNGFATSAPSSSGAVVTYRGGAGFDGSSAQTLNNQLYPDSSFIVAIDSSTTPGGNIQTTRDGNHDGTLRLVDSNDAVLEPGFYSAPENKSVTYTMTQQPGYKLDKVIVDGTDVTSQVKGTETQNADGLNYYTYEFQTITSDHVIHVAWKPITASVEATKLWEDFNNGFDTRGDAVPLIMHLTAGAVDDRGVSNTYPEDYFLPAQKIDSTADGQSVIWGEDAAGYTDVDGNTLTGYNESDTSTYPDGTQSYTGPASVPAGILWRNQYFYDYDYETKKLTQYEYNAATDSYDFVQAYDNLNYLPKVDEFGDLINYSVVEEEAKGYTTTYIKTKDGNEADPNKAVHEYDVTNLLDPVGTVKIVVDKALDGRALTATDKYSFTLSGEDGSPMPVEQAATPGSGDAEAPKKTVEDMVDTDNFVADTVRGKAEFDIITYTKDDLEEKEVKYSDGKDTPTAETDISIAERDSIRFWYVAREVPGKVLDMCDPAQKAELESLVNTYPELVDSITGTLYKNDFTYYITEKPTDKVEGGDLETRPVTNDTSTKEITVNVLLDQVANNGAGAILVSALDNSGYKTGQDATVYTKQEIEDKVAKVELNSVYFRNVYDSQGAWEPEAIKVLTGRPLERDQFNFRIHVHDDSDAEVAANFDATGWVSYTPFLHARNADGELLYYTADGTEMKTLAEGGIETKPVKITNSQLVGAENKDANGDLILVSGDPSANDIRQDVEKDAAAANKGTDDLYGPISFDRITYTNADLAKRINYGDAGTDKVVYWRDGETLYGPIPDNATNSQDIVIEGVTYAAGSLAYGTATDAQREAAKGDTANSIWQWTDTEGIVDPDPNAKGKTYSQVIGTTIELDAATGTPVDGRAKFYVETTDPATRTVTRTLTGIPSGIGVYYEATRDFTYVIWEQKTGSDWGYTSYDADAAQTKAEASAKLVTVSISDQGDGAVEVTEPEAPVFNNSYEAQGKVEIKGTKKLDDRAEFGRGTFTGAQTFTFKLEAVTAGAPMPGSAEVSITPADGNTAEFSFGSATFTHENLMDGTNYAANRSQDGDYERTFIYKITETAITGNSGAEGMENENSPSSDARNAILVAITVREDKYGNITVAAVNGADATDIAADKFEKENISFSVDNAGDTAYPASYEDKSAYEAQSTVKAGTIYNTYQATGEINLTATKVLEGKTLAANMFYFELSNAADGSVVDEKPNAADGTIAFDTIVYNLNQVRADADAGLCDGPGTDAMDENGPWTYSYKVKELVPADGAKAAGIVYDTSEKTIKVKVEDNGDGTLTATVTEGADPEFANYAETIDVDVEKVWDDDALELLASMGYDRPKTVSVTLKADGVAVGAPVALSGGDWTYTWEDLPRYTYTSDAQGDVTKTDIVYTLEEAPVPAGYEAVVTDETDADGNISFTVTNTPNVADLLDADLVLHKVDSVTGKNIAGVGFSLEGPAGTGISETYTTDAYGVIHINFEEAFDTALISGTTELTLKEVAPAAGYNANTDEYKLTVEGGKVSKVELRSPGKTIFEQLWSFIVGDAASAEFANGILTVKNTPVANPITVTKEFTGLDDDVDPAELFSEFEIKASYMDATGAEKTATLRLSDSGVVYDESAKTYTWTIEGVAFGSEVKVEEKPGSDPKGYELVLTSASSDASDYEVVPEISPVAAMFTMPDKAVEVNLENEYEKQLADLTVEKVWNDNDNQDGKRPGSVTVKVTSSADASFEEQLAISGSSWTGTLRNLPAYDAHDNPITYTIVEDAVPDYSADAAQYTATLENGDATIIVTNTHEPALGKVSVTKVWDDDNNAAGMRDETEVYLFANGLLAPDLSYHIITTDDTSTVEWTGLPIYKDGSPISYSVKESAVKGYATSYSADAVQIDPATGEASIEITNSYEPEFGSIVIAKLWEDADDQDGFRPSAITVAINAEDADGNPMPVFDGESSIDVQVTADGSWLWSSDDAGLEIPKIHEGKAVYYSVGNERFESKDEYDCFIEYGGSGMFLISNIHEPEEVSVFFDKAWEDGDDADGIRPTAWDYADSYVHLKAATPTAGDITSRIAGAAHFSLDFETLANEYEVVWPNLPKYYKGELVTYTIAEDPVPLYEASASEVEAEAVSDIVYRAEMTNTHAVERMDITVRKVWADEGAVAHDGDALQRSVSIQLKADGAQVGPDMALNDENGWTYTWQDMPKKDGDGDAIDYEVAEVAVPFGYSESYETETDADGNITVTVTNTPDAEALLKACIVIKKVDAVTGAPVAGAGFTLADAAGATIATYTTDASGLAVISKDDLALENEGTTYTLTETAVPAGFDESAAVSYTIKVASGDVEVKYNTDDDIFQRIYGFVFGEPEARYDAATHTLTVENAPKTYPVAVSKQFTGLNEGDDPKTFFEDFKIALNYIDATGAEQSATLTLDDAVLENGVYSWPAVNALFGSTFKAEESGYDIDAYTFQGSAINVSGASDYETFSADTPTSVELTVPSTEAAVEFSNSYAPTLTNVAARATWEGDDYDAPMSELERRPSAVPVKLQQKVDGQWVDVADKVGELSESNNWATQFEGLPAYDSANTAIEYRVVVVEGDEPSGYSVSYAEPTIAPTLTGSVIQFKYNIEKLEGTKTWVDGGKTHDNASEITLTVTDNEGASYIAGVDYHVDWEGNDYIIRGLETVDGRTYTVTEEPVIGYTASDDGNGNFTNTINQETIEIPVTKTWVGANSEPVTVTLVVDGTESSKTLTFESDGTQSFTELPKYALDGAGDGSDDGHEIVYTIVESIGSSSYHTSIAGTAATGFTITNAFDETAIPVVKVWDDNNNQDGLRPGSVTLHLLLPDGSPAVDLHGNEVGPLTLDAASGWAGGWKDVPRTDAAGELIAYQVSEDAVAAYSTSIEGDAENGFVVTNSYLPDTTTVTAAKVWDDTAGGDESLHTDVILHLYGMNDGLIVYDAGTKKIAADSGETATWIDLPRRHYSDTDLEWVIYEESVFGYAASMEWDGNHCTVTNTYYGPTTTVSARKVWQDDNNRDGKRPDSVTFQLMQKIGDAEPTPYGEPQVISADAEGMWPTVTWNGLPATADVDTGATEQSSRIEYQEIERQATDAEGNALYVNTADEADVITEAAFNELSDDEKAAYEALMEVVNEPVEVTEDVPVVQSTAILYSVVETDAPEGYDEPVVNAVAPGQFEVVNARSSYDTTSLSVSKTWVDDDNAEGIRPDHITVTLFADGEELESRTVTADDGWTTTFENLQLNRAGEVATPIEYTVSEAEVEGYTASISYGEGFASIVNTHGIEPSLTLNVTKVWAGDEDDTSTRKDVVLHLMKVVEGYGPVEVEGAAKTIPASATGDALTVSWTDLAAIEDGKGVTYTVTEDPVEGYTTSLSDGEASGSTIKITVTNTKIPAPEPGVEPKVTYLDPKNPAASMILSATKYASQEEADAEAQSKASAPVDPSHEGYVFTGWAVTQDQFGDYIIVATYNQVTPASEVVVSFVDPLAADGSRLVSSTLTNDPSSVGYPANPSHAGYVFKGWALTVDAGGNWVYTALYEPIQKECPSCDDCKNPVTPTPKKGVIPATGDPAAAVGAIFGAGTVAVAVAGAARRRKR